MTSIRLKITLVSFSLFVFLGACSHQYPVADLDVGGIAHVKLLQNDGSVYMAGECSNGCVLGSLGSPPSKSVGKGDGGPFGEQARPFPSGRTRTCLPGEAHLAGLEGALRLVWPRQWELSVVELTGNNQVGIGLVCPEQAEALTGIHLRSSSGGVITDIQASGRATYALDLTELADGAYILELKFRPGFSLLTPILKLTA